MSDPEMTTFGMHPEQEPVAYLVVYEGGGKLLSFDENNYLHGENIKHIPLYPAPQKRRWEGLTDEEIKKLSDDCAGVRDETEFIRAIEAKLKEKNT